jgi:hypothetical protein
MQLSGNMHHSIGGQHTYHEVLANALILPTGVLIVGQLLLVHQLLHLPECEPAAAAAAAAAVIAIPAAAAAAKQQQQQQQQNKSSGTSAITTQTSCLGQSQ